MEAELHDGQTSSPPVASGSSFFGSIRRTQILRSQNRWVGGVAGGIAAHFGWDPMIVRGVLFVVSLFGGVGFLLYGLGWALLPDATDGRIQLEEATQGRFSSPLVGAIIMALIGLSSGAPIPNLASGFFGFFQIMRGIFWAVFWVLAVVFVFRWLRKRRELPGRVEPLASVSFTSPAFEPAPAPAFQWVMDDDEAETWTTNATARQQTMNEQMGVRYQKALRKAQRPIVKGPGRVTVFALLGFLLVLTALFISGAYGMSAPFFTGASLLLLGVGISISGIRGRRGGLLTFLAACALFVGVFSAGVVGHRSEVNTPLDGNVAIQMDNTTMGDIREGLMAFQLDSFASGVGVNTFAPTTLAQAEQGFSMQVGTMTVDLSQLDFSALETDNPLVIPLGLSAGDMTVILPNNSAVEVEIERLLAGEFRMEVDGPDNTAIFSGVNPFGLVRVSEEAVAEGAVVRLVVNIGAGQLVVTEAQFYSALVGSH